LFSIFRDAAVHYAEERELFLACENVEENSFKRRLRVNDNPSIIPSKISMRKKKVFKGKNKSWKVVKA
jgi:hypothetical protein